MMPLLLYASLFAFAVVYLLRALLMAGYEILNQKHEKRKNTSIFKSWVSHILLLKPITQAKLKPRSIDHKVHMRFQQKSTIYYFMLWACLFVILFLSSKIYLGLFS